MNTLYNFYFYLLFKIQKQIFGLKWAHAKQIPLKRVCDFLIFIHIVLVFLITRYLITIFFATGITALEIFIWICIVLYFIFKVGQKLNGEKYIIVIEKLDRRRKEEGILEFIAYYSVFPVLILSIAFLRTLVR